MDGILEQEERQNNVGSLENKCLNRKYENFSIISNEPDPLDALIAKEEGENLPIIKALMSLDLTDYQRRVAVEYYLHNKTQAQIAKEFGVSGVSIGRLLAKARKKILKHFF